MIAIVDDDEAVRKAMASLLRSLGHRVAAFDSAQAFLESDQLRTTTCLITDVQMPGLSGLDLQSQLIATGHKVPIIFITAYPDDDLRTRGMQAGAVCFIGKPYSEDYLIGCLEKAHKAS